MIHDALRLLVNELNRKLVSSGDGDAVTLGNIAQADQGSEGADESSNLSRVVLSLVNLTEDQTLKNGPHHRLRDGKVVYENRPVSLYLYLLFSANNAVYSTALKHLSAIIEFFQGKNVFTIRNSPDLTGLSSEKDLSDFRLVLELHSLTFEQVNHLWGSLGGKQLPFVLYRARLLRLTAEETLGVGEPVTDISVGERNSATTTTTA